MSTTGGGGSVSQTPFDERDGAPSSGSSRQQPPSQPQEDERSRSSRNSRSTRVPKPEENGRSGGTGTTSNQQQKVQQGSQQQQQQPQPQPYQRPHTTSMIAQPHGAPAIGPTSSTLSQQQYYAAQQQQQQAIMMSKETSPLPPMVQRSLGDRSNEKRKNAALEIEALIKSLTEANNFTTVNAIISVLSKDFCTSMNSNYRKGGLVGLAATAIGLHSATSNFLHVLLPPVLHCFDDPESRVRYYACESLYNMAKVSRQSILAYFSTIFEGLTKLFADVDVDVKNGANLLDRLIKDVVTEANSDTFQVDKFLPVMQNYIRRTNPYIRQLIVGWITLLDSLPDISMLDYLPDFLDGLFNMLSDSNREIRQAADSALSDFLRELSVSQVLEFGPIISVLVFQCQSKERLNRLTAMTWLAELTHHPLSGGDALLPFLPDILSAILFCISDHEREIRLVAERTNDDLLQLVRATRGDFELRPVLETLTNELLEKEDVPTKMAALRWINMLMEKRMRDMQVFTVHLLPVLLRTLSDPSDAVVLLDLQVLSRISLAKPNDLDNGAAAAAGDKKKDDDDNNNDGNDAVDNDGNSLQEESEEAQFQLVLNAILNLFAQDRQLLETRGSLIIRKLCVLLNAKAVYIRISDTLSSYEYTESNDKQDQASTYQFISTMVQTLNLILLTATELHDLRSALANSFEENQARHQRSLSSTSVDADDDGTVFATLFHCWCHNPVATFSLCLLSKTYDLSFALVKRFSDMEDISVGFLMQIDKLVHLLESPIFVHLRLSLLNVESPYHAHLLKSIYGLLMCLPQGEAFRLLNDRLTTVCNLRDNLGVRASQDNGDAAAEALVASIVSRRGLDIDKLLDRFDAVMERHRDAKDRAQQKIDIATKHEIDHHTASSSGAGGGGAGGAANRADAMTMSGGGGYPSIPNAPSMASSVGRHRATPVINNVSPTIRDTRNHQSNGDPVRVTAINQHPSSPSSDFRSL